MNINESVAAEGRNTPVPVKLAEEHAALLIDAVAVCRQRGIRVTVSALARTLLQHFLSAGQLNGKRGVAMESGPLAQTELKKMLSNPDFRARCRDLEETGEAEIFFRKTIEGWFVGVWCSHRYLRARVVFDLEERAVAAERRKSKPTHVVTICLTKSEKEALRNLISTAAPLGLRRSKTGESRLARLALERLLAFALYVGVADGLSDVLAANANPATKPCDSHA
ncbi:MAG: hypothetical protein L0Y58_00400 [Verrucomicrobia subdivision 3 bacterium]|nr:hypothetical protein [Limisphaerales bacterium]